MPAKAQQIALQKTTSHTANLNHIQHKLMAPLHSAASETLLSGDMPDRHKAHLLSAAGDVDALSATPSSPQLQLSNAQTSTVLARRLLLPLYGSPGLDGTCLCPRCGKSMDVWGDHTLLCSSGGSGLEARTKFWHDPVARIIAQVLRACGQHVRLESKPPPSRLSTNKRADLLITSPEQALTLGDVRTCVTSESSVVSLAASVPAHAAHQGQKKKEADWSEIAHYSGCAFAPLAVEDGGRLGPALVNLISRSILSYSTSNREAALSMVSARQRIHVANIKGVADTILRNPAPRAPPGFRSPLVPHPRIDLPPAIPRAFRDSPLPRREDYVSLPWALQMAPAPPANSATGPPLRSMAPPDEQRASPPAPPPDTSSIRSSPLSAHSSTGSPDVAQASRVQRTTRQASRRGLGFEARAHHHSPSSPEPPPLEEE